MNMRHGSFIDGKSNKIRIGPASWCYLFLTIILVLVLKAEVSSGIVVSDLSVHKVPLRRADDASPYCYAVSSISNLKSHHNFLATQVWPAARLAATFVQEHPPENLVVCELGCGPGLPALTAASSGAKQVIATDLDPLALELVAAAARDQALAVHTEEVDLCGDHLPIADLYILSDVFESAAVATRAARLLHENAGKDSMIWIFCQSDRAQREPFQRDLSNRMGEDLRWTAVNDYDPANRICLFNVEEGEVLYG